MAKIQRGIIPKPGIYHKNQKGEVLLSYSEYNRLRNVCDMSPDERREWKFLGVHLTNNKERQIECFGASCDFMISGVII